MPKSIRIVSLSYTHRFGTDVYTLRVPDDMEELPEITNELVKALGYDDCDLQRGETADWGPITTVDELKLVPLVHKDLSDTAVASNIGCTVTDLRAQRAAEDNP